MTDCWVSFPGHHMLMFWVVDQPEQSAQRVDIWQPGNQTQKYILRAYWTWDQWTLRTWPTSHIIKPLTGDIDDLVTVQCSAGKPWVHVKDPNHQSKHCWRLWLPHGSSTRWWQWPPAILPAPLQKLLRNGPRMWLRAQGVDLASKFAQIPIA